MFDLSLTKLLVLAVIALLVFGPHELPRIASQAGRALRDLRRIADGAKADLREGLGPEFQDFDFDDLNPRRFVRKHLLDDVPDSPEPLLADYNGSAGDYDGSSGAGLGVTATDGGRATVGGGANPPFDLEAT